MRLRFFDCFSDDVVIAMGQGVTAVIAGRREATNVNAFLSL